ncbi:unnamed protein product [Amaranthus hypochondriacus]
MKTEEDAFWMLAVLLEDVLVNDCYTNNLSGCHVEQRVFQDLVTKKCPSIAAHLEALEFDVPLVATEWFLCLFSKSLPSEVSTLNNHFYFFCLHFYKIDDEDRFLSRVYSPDHDAGVGYPFLRGSYGLVSVGFGHI